MLWGMVFIQLHIAGTGLGNNHTSYNYIDIFTLLQKPKPQR